MRRLESDWALKDRSSSERGATIITSVLVLDLVWSLLGEMSYLLVGGSRG